VIQDRVVELEPPVGGVRRHQDGDERSGESRGAAGARDWAYPGIVPERFCSSHRNALACAGHRGGCNDACRSVRR
jgi:hypothetical protein